MKLLEKKLYGEKLKEKDIVGNLKNVLAHPPLLRIAGSILFDDATTYLNLSSLNDFADAHGLGHTFESTKLTKDFIAESGLASGLLRTELHNLSSYILPAAGAALAIYGLEKLVDRSDLKEEHKRAVTGIMKLSRHLMLDAIAFARYDAGANNLATAAFVLSRPSMAFGSSRLLMDATRTASYIPYLGLLAKSYCSKFKDTLKGALKNAYTVARDSIQRKPGCSRQGP